MTLRRVGEYASFKQWTELGGHIRKGAKGEIVVFYKWQTYRVPADKKDEADEDEKKWKLKEIEGRQSLFAFMDKPLFLCVLLS